MKISKGPFSYEKNLDQVRKLLLEIYEQTGELHYLIPTKIENQKYGPCGPNYSPQDDDVFRIWRVSNEDDSEIVAVSHRGSAGNYHIEIHPDYKHLEKNLFLEIEKIEGAITGEEPSKMYMYTVSSDTNRPKVLVEMDYEDYGLHEYNYMFPLEAPIPDIPLPEGFAVKDLRNEEDYVKFIEVIGSAYDHCQQYMTLDKMKFMMQAEFYHQDLNLVVTDKAGRFVAFCMFRLDPFTGIGEIEALDAHPDFGNLRLEKALLSEGLRNMMKHKPRLICCVEVDVSEPLNQMLESVGFVRSVTMNMWGKMV